MTTPNTPGSAWAFVSAITCGVASSVITSAAAWRHDERLSCGDEDEGVALRNAVRKARYLDRDSRLPTCALWLDEMGRARVMGDEEGNRDREAYQLAARALRAVEKVGGLSILEDFIEKEKDPAQTIYELTRTETARGEIK